jgi:hypothetical protein
MHLIATICSRKLLVSGSYVPIRSPFLAFITFEGGKERNVHAVHDQRSETFSKSRSLFKIEIWGKPSVRGVREIESCMTQGA